jgi:(Z)-2-((N-methylformamido)methylene)-5-hydroxybutyrolactone dehydrogenase
VAATKHLIGGEWRDGAGPAIPNINPATGKQVGEVSVATREEVDAAVTAAHQAFEGGWADTPISHRRKLILRLAQLVADKAPEVAPIATEDNGMPAALTYGETVFMAEWFEYFAGWADKIEGETIPVAAPFVLDYTLREPVGVVAAILPWNAPMGIGGFKIGPALATGNTIVIKPSEHAPRALAMIADLAAEAGFPPGVLNLVTGDGSTGAALVEHPGVRAVSFTGGTEHGRRVGETCGRLLKRVTLELGGKSANIVFADADLDMAAVMAAQASFLYTGQACIAGSRLLVEERIHDAFVAKVIEQTRAITVGDPFKPETQIGPLIAEPALTRVLGYVEGARQEAEVATGGERLGGDLADGYFVGPTVITKARNDMRLAREEIFGPVLAVIPFADADEAVRIANDTPYGLTAGIWTNDLNKAHGLSRRLQSGSVWVNSWFAFNPMLPFGGMKDSGIGKEGGKESLAHFTQTKNVYIQLKP